MLKKKSWLFWHIYFDNWLFGISEPVFKKTLQEDPVRLHKSYPSKSKLVFYFTNWKDQFIAIEFGNWICIFIDRMRQKFAGKLLKNWKMTRVKLLPTELVGRQWLQFHLCQHCQRLPWWVRLLHHLQVFIVSQNFQESAIILGESDYMLKKVHAKKIREIR